MSYCRFIEGDVYVFTSNLGIECCGCWLQEREWVDEPNIMLGGYFKAVGEIIPTVFRSNQEMIEHLEKHVAAGYYVPEHAFERLRDPQDEAENKAIWEKYDREKKK